MKMATKYALALAAALTLPAAQAAASNGVLVGYNALNLMPSQQRGCLSGRRRCARNNPPQHYLIYVGGLVPAPMQLKALPAPAVAQVPQLKNDDYVKLNQGQLLLVKPQNRTIVEIIDRYHGTAAETG